MTTTIEHDTAPAACACSPGDAALRALAAPGWYAVHTRSNFEKRILSDLTAKGFEVYMPVLREAHRWKDRKKLIERPIFAGYVFVRTAATARNILRVLETAGTVRILGARGTPERIPDQEILAIMTMQASGLSLTVESLPVAGSPVRVCAGALKGLEGVLLRVKNAHRLIVSIPLLCQAVCAEVNCGDVKPLHVRRLAQSA